MKRFKYIVLLLAAVVLAGCGTKRKVQPQPAVVTPAEPAWHTCLIQNAQIKLIRDGEQYSSPATMQTVRDSMLVISVMPMLGMEVLRLEATPTQLTAIDKLHGQYAVTTYEALNNKLTPALTWEILQQMASAELPTGDQKARLQYALGNETVELVIDYTPRRLDVPVRVNAMRVDRYTKIDISRWLK